MDRNVRQNAGSSEGRGTADLGSWTVFSSADCPLRIPSESSPEYLGVVQTHIRFHVLQRCWAIHLTNKLARAYVDTEKRTEKHIITAWDSSEMHINPSYSSIPINGARIYRLGVAQGPTVNMCMTYQRYSIH